MWQADYSDHPWERKVITGLVAGRRIRILNTSSFAIAFVAWKLNMPRKTIHTDQHSVLLALLREYRQRQRLRQADIAERLGWDQATVSNVERGERRLDVIELRAWLFALEADYLEFMKRLDERLPWGTFVVSTRRRRPAAAAESVALNAAQCVSKARSLSRR